MAITTISDAINKMQPVKTIYKVGTTTVASRLFSPFYSGGFPGAATTPSPGLSGASLTSYTNSLPFTNPFSGNTYLSKFSANCPVSGTLFLCDRLWHNSGIVVTTTSMQIVDSVAWPPRDRNGLSAGTDVMIGVEVSTAMGAGTPTFAMMYRNDQGVINSAITAAQSATMAVGSFIPIQLVSGDTGVQMVSGWTQSTTMTLGAYHLVAYRIIAALTVLNNYEATIDAISAGFPRLYDNTVPFFLWLPNGTTGPNISARIIYSQG